VPACLAADVYEETDSMSEPDRGGFGNHRTNLIERSYDAKMGISTTISVVK
jgi:hypothetical protein